VSSRREKKIYYRKRKKAKNSTKRVEGLDEDYGRPGGD